MSGAGKNVLLLGGMGFAGRHMQQLLARDHQVLACGSEVDVRDLDAVRKVVGQCKWDWVASFASITTVKESFEDPSGTYAIGFLGTLNILMALKEVGFDGRVLNISSSEVYGHPTPDDLPIAETADLRPLSPYSVSKAATELLCYQWSRSEGIDVVTARPFTHIGPGQSARFAISNFSRQLAEIKLGLKEAVMHVGDTSTTRDFTDVRDAVRAYRMLLESGEPGLVYNVCSGREVSLQDVLDQLIAITGMAIRVETDSTMLRATEQRRLLGSYEKLKQATQWQPEIGLKQTLSDTFDYWLRELSSGVAAA